MKPIKVMVVDDSAFMRVVIKDIIESDPSMQVIETAKNGEEALEKLESVHPEIITLDVEMPILDGIETLERLILKNVNIPIIMLSSTSKLGIENTIKALHLGAFDFIKKPTGNNSYNIEKVKNKLIHTIKLAIENQDKNFINPFSIMEDHKEQAAATLLDGKEEEKEKSLALESSIEQMVQENHTPPQERKINERQKQEIISHVDEMKEQDKSSIESQVIRKKDLPKQEPDLQDEKTKKLNNRSQFLTAETAEKIDQDQSQTTFTSLPRIDQRKRESREVIKKEMKQTHLLHKETKKETNTLKQIILVGTSTGGPRALQQLLSLLPNLKHAAILVVQHMPPSFTNSLAKRLDQLTVHDVVEAQHNEEIRAGHVYIAPGGFHMQLIQKNMKAYIALNNEAPRGGHRPSVDVMIESSVDIEGFKIISVIMTGMGKDGLQGTKLFRERKVGYTIAEDRTTCVVYGMPRAIIEAGLADEVVPLHSIPLVLERLIKS